MSQYFHIAVYKYILYINIFIYIYIYLHIYICTYITHICNYIYNRKHLKYICILICIYIYIFYISQLNFEKIKVYLLQPQFQKMLMFLNVKSRI